jgi:hypothetical protein
VLSAEVNIPCRYRKEAMKAIESSKLTDELIKSENYVYLINKQNAK